MRLSSLNRCPYPCSLVFLLSVRRHAILLIAMLIDVRLDALSSSSGTVTHSIFHQPDSYTLMSSLKRITHAASIPAPPPPADMTFALPSTTNLGAMKRLLTIDARFQLSSSVCALLHHDCNLSFCSDDRLSRRSCSDELDDEEEEEDDGDDADEVEENKPEAEGRILPSSASLNRRFESRTKYSRKL